MRVGSIGRRRSNKTVRVASANVEASFSRLGKSPFRNQSETGLDGLAGRGGCDFKQVFEALLELTCGPRPTERNISARAQAMEAA
jgi:hypothetical protein